VTLVLRVGAWCSKVALMRYCVRRCQRTDKCGNFIY